jgi:hypothetical protein
MTDLQLLFILLNILLFFAYLLPYRALCSSSFMGAPHSVFFKVDRYRKRWLKLPLLSINLLNDFPILRTILLLNPFAILFEAYRSVIWGTWPDGPPTAPDWLSLALLALASTFFLAIATVVFKRLEPNFAKVL